MALRSRDLWISVPAAKILFEKLTDMMKEAVNNSGIFLLNLFKFLECLTNKYKNKFLDVERIYEITLELLPAKNIAFGNFKLQILQENLMDNLFI